MRVKSGVVDYASSTITLEILGCKGILNLSALELYTLCLLTHNITIIWLLICLVLSILLRMIGQSELKRGIVLSLALHLPLVVLLLLFDLLRSIKVDSYLL